MSQDRSNPKRTVSFLTLVLAVVALVTMGARDTQAQDRLTADFDWSMPDRYVGGPAANDDDVSSIVPNTFRVDFDASYSTGTIESYTWLVDGTVVGQVSESAFSYEFSEEGTYRVALVVKAPGGRQKRVVKKVLVEDWLVVGLGDSYASGEGVPDVPAQILKTSETFPDEIVLEEGQRGLVTPEIPATCNGQRDGFETDGSCRLPGIVLPERSAKCNGGLGTWQNGRCWTTLPQQVCTRRKCRTIPGVPGVVTPAIPTTCNGRADGFEPDGSCTLPGVETPAIASTCNGNPNGFDDNNECWLRPPTKAIPAQWQNEQCHRSAKSGQALAALKLEKQDPRTSVTFVHVACSGAKITRGLVGGYDGIKPPSKNAPDLAPQIEQVRELVGARGIDILLVSIGGNDVNFAPLMMKCMGDEPCYDPQARLPLGGHPIPEQGPIRAYCKLLGSELEDKCYEELWKHQAGEHRDATELFEDGLNGISDYDRCRVYGDPADPNACLSLAEKYNLLADAIQNDLALAPERVFLTQYPDATRNEKQEYCGNAVTDWSSLRTDWDSIRLLKNFPGVTYDEMQWADTFVEHQLSEAMATAAETHGWQFVGDLYTRFQGHGYCSEQNWFVRLQDSLASQTDINGTAHPSIDGTVAYCEAISQKVTGAFYGVPTLGGESCDALGGTGR